MVGALLAVAGGLLVAVGNRFDLYGADSVAVIDVAIISLLFIAIIVAEGIALRRAERLRGESLQVVQESEARLRQQIERMPIACITLSRGMIVSSWNPAAERIFGYSEEEIVGHSILPILPDGMTGDANETWLRLLGGDSAAHLINENLTRDGRTIVCRWTNTPLIDANGVVTAILAMAEDITEERNAQTELVETETRYRQHLDQLPHFVFSVDAEDRYTAVNAAACAFFGRPLSEIIGRTALELGSDPATAVLWTTQNAKTRESGMMQTADCTAMFNERLCSFRAITSPLRDLSGVTIGVTGVSIDMTDLKIAEASAERLLHAVEQLDEVVFTTDRNGTITYVNPAFEKVYGYSASEAVGQTPRLLKCDDVPPERHVELWAELLAGRSVRMEYRNRRKDGGFVDVIGSANPIFDESGVSGFIAVQEDATALKRAAEDRRRLDERLEHLARMEALGTLAGGIAHDFNNILAIIITHTALIERRHSEPAILARALDALRQAVRRGSVLARQVLTFANRADIKLEAVNVAQLIAGVASMISESLAPNISLKTDVAPDLPLLSADEGQLHRSLLNLCMNANEAMPEGGELTIDARRRSEESMKEQFPDASATDYVVISVSDTGVGIDEETRRHIFEPFYSKKARGKATGLGLALVFGVANNHGGLIDVESHVGDGSVFRLYLPLDRAAAMAHMEPDYTTPGETPPLLVEEEQARVL
jgi:two-component system cell cycle sensor histidine kinase/response regulator CckA